MLRSLYLLTIIFSLAGCQTQRLAVCPDVSTSYAGEKFKYVKTKKTGKVAHQITASFDNQVVLETSSTNPKDKSTAYSQSTSQIEVALKKIPKDQRPIVAQLSMITDHPANTYTKATKQKKLKLPDPDEDEIHFMAKRYARFSLISGLVLPFVSAFLPGFTLILMVGGILLGVKSLKLYKTIENQEGRGMAIAGLALNGIWLVIIILAILIILAVFYAWSPV